ncbi:SDR family oxidoreductase [Kribbella shirazensis]|uniref:NAD(P)-dependent dehydrogenase (Short-subunit alcohol dehydrogenase family) n=1 Tax=Kribbella shirazensis TaxID=1105143 RepID=A0A7X5VJA4_9ACTN|nr:SDR family oxidoreductase [Kribbella shirazensis]NIK61417.1 NAD(P)-dependent dehydrogenase (short-subunit alcohol dehydrogenase family) [Kribbella shirazensis]
MKILLIGDAGRLGAGLARELTGRGHEVLGASRSHAERSVDLSDPASIDALYSRLGQIDAVACAAGHVVYKPSTAITHDEYLSSFVGKALGQIELLRRGLATITPHGSFTFITGTLVRTAIRTGSAGAMVNGALEAFVRAAAMEIARSGSTPSARRSSSTGSTDPVTSSPASSPCRSSGSY